MAKKQGDIRFGVQFQVDKSGLNELKASLQQLNAMSDKELIKLNPKATTNDLNEIRKSVEQVQKALEDSFNPKLDTTDLTKFRKSLNDLNIPKLKADFDKFGESGKNAFRNLTVEILTTKRHLKESSQWLDKMAETLSNTVRWTIASSAVNALTGSVQKAFSYTQKLDKSLNDIVIVTGKGSDEMERFARKANDAAKTLGATTTDYTKAALIYYQQGLSDTDVQARANVTTKVSNVTGQSADTTSEQLTAIWNGYKVSAQEAELYIDKVSAVAATTAADLEELATGMSKVASAANIMGVDIDSLNAQLATIVSVTREAPESIGTALKTVYARMSDIEAGLDTETTLGEYTSQMQVLGIEALDAQGNLRDMGDVVEEIGGKWDGFSRNQQVALAQIIAGTRQYSRMMALFDNWDMYESAKSTSENSIGALQQQNDRYMNSMEAHLNQLTATAEGLYDTLLDPESLNPLIDVLTGVVGLIDQMIQGLGGGGQLLINLGAIGVNVFGDQITKGISKTIRNIQGFKENLQQAASEAMIIQQYGITDIEDERTKELVELAKQRLKIANKLSQEERDASDALIIQTNELYKQQDALKKKKETAEEIAKNYTGKDLDFNDIEQTKKDIEASAEAIKKELDKEGVTGISKILDAKKKVNLKDSRMGTAERGGLAAAEAEDEEFFKQKVQEYNEQAEAKIQANEKLIQTEEDYKKAIGALVKELQDESNASEQTSLAAKANKEEKVKLEKIVKAVTAAFDEEGNLITEDVEKIEAANVATKEYNKLAEEMRKRGKDVATSLDDLNKELDENKKKLDENKEGLKGLKDSFKLTDTISNVADLASGIANIGASIQTLHNLGSIWKNEDLTTGEKLLQTITNVGFAFGMLASSMKTMSGLSLTNIKKTIAHIAALKEKAKADKEAAAASKEHAAAETAEGVATEGSTKAAKKSATSGKNVSTSSKIGFGVAAALAAFAVSSKLVNSAANQEEEAAEAANKAAQAAQENIQQVKQGIEELKNATDLISSEDVFKGLTKGSFEWNQALLENNEKVLALTKKYKDLETRINTTTGALELTEESLTKVQNQELAQVYRAQGASVIAAQQAKNSNIANLKDEYAESINNSAAKNVTGIGVGTVAGGIGGAILGSMAAGAVTGTAAGTAVPGLGNAVGLIVGLAVGAVVGVGSAIATNAIVQAEEERIKENANADLDKLAEAYMIQGEGLFSSNETLIAALGKNADALTESQKALLANTNEVKDLIREMASFKRERFERDSQFYTNQLLAMGYNSQDAAAIGGIISANKAKDENLNQAQIEEQKKKLKKIRKDKSTIMEWAYAMGLDISESDITDISGKGFKYKDANGDVHEVASDTMIEQLATWKVSQSYVSQTETIHKQLTELFKGLEKESIGALQAIFASGNALQAKNVAFTTTLYEELQDKLEAVKEISDLANESLDATLKALQAYYLDNQGAAFVADQGWSKEVHEALKTVFIEEGKEWSNIFDEFSSTMIETFGDVFQKVESVGGEDAVKSMKTILQRAGVKNAGQIMSSIDWAGSTTLAADFSQQMAALGEQLDASSDQGFAVIYALSRMNGQMVLTRESIAEVADILSQLTNASKSLSKTEYESLIATYGSAINQYFALMADGTYRLTTSAAEFYNVVRGDQKEIAAQNMTAALELFNNTINHGITVGNIDKQVKTDVQAQTVGTWTRDALLNIANTQRVANQNQAIDLFKMYLDTAAGEGLKNSLTNVWGDLTQVSNWNKIVDGISGAGARIDINASGWQSIWAGKKGYKEISYSEMINAILADADDKATKAAPEYHAKEQLQSKAQEMLAKGLIDQVQYDEYISNLGSQTFLAIDTSGKSDAQRWLEDHLKAAEGGSETAKTDALEAVAMRVGLASSQKEVDQILEEFQQSTLFSKLTPEEQQKALDDLNKTYSETIELATERRYEDENKAIEANITLLDEQLHLLESIGEALVGDDYLENLTLQTQKLKDQIKLLEKRKELTQNEIKAEQNNRNSDFNTDVAGLAGLMRIPSANLWSVIQDYMGYSLDGGKIATVEDYNAWILAVEKLIQDKLANASQDTQDAANTYVANIKENIGTLFSSLATTDAEIANKNREVYDTLLEHFETSLNNKLDLAGMKREFNQFVNDMFVEADDYFGQGSLLAQDFQLLQQDLTSIEEAYRELNDTELSISDKRTKGLELQKQYQEKMLELKESINQLEEVQISQMDEIAEQYQDQISYLEEINSLYDHQIAITELIGKKNGESLEQYNDRLEAYYKQQENNLADMWVKYQDEYIYWQSVLATSTEGTDAYENAQEKMLAAGKNAAALGVEYGQMVADNFKRSVENSVNELFEGLSWAKEELDWLRADADRYYNTIDALFEINKLEASIRKDLNSNTSLNTQRKINEFLEEQVESLREIDRLSEADLKRAQAKYDLLQAQIALEEAQANKTQMRLVRGADGSYSYEYVADTNAIAEREQEVLEAQQAIVDLDKEEVSNHFDEIYDIAQTFIEKYISAFEDRKIEDHERAFLGDIWNSLVEQLGDTDVVVNKLRESIASSAKLLGIESLQDLSDEDMAALFPDLDSSMYDLYKGWLNGGTLNNAAFEKLMTADSGTALELLKSIGLKTDSITGSVGSTYEDLMTETAAAMAQSKTDLGELTELVDDAKEAYDEMAESLKKVVAEMALANMVAKGNGLTEALELISDSLGVFNTKLTEGATADLAAFGVHGFDSFEQAGRFILNDLNWEGSTKNFFEQFYQADPAAFQLFLSSLPDIQKEAVKKMMGSYDTGGYTGEWGPEGKFLLAHEKELILNKTDTENILNAVDIIRNLQFSLDASVANRLAEMTSAHGSSMQALGEAKDWVIEQNIEINAEFPNATDSSEIEKAFEELLNMAAQRIAER